MKKQKAPRLVTVAIFTTVTLIFWVFYSLYNVLISKTDPKVDSKLLEPLDPTLNRDALNKLRDRVFFEESEVNFSVSTNITTAPTPIPTSDDETTPSPTAVPVEEGEPTPEGG